MMPSLDFRWTTDRDAVLKPTSRRSNAAAADKHSASTSRPRHDDAAGRMGRARISRPRARRRDRRDLSWRAIGASSRRRSRGGSRSAAATRRSSWPDRWSITIEQRRDSEADRGLRLRDRPRALGTRVSCPVQRKAGRRRSPGDAHDSRRQSVLAGRDRRAGLSRTGTGKPLWSVNILEQNDTENLDWAMAGLAVGVRRPGAGQPGQSEGHGRTAARSRRSTPPPANSLWGGGEAKASYCLADARHAGRHAAGADLRRESGWPATTPATAASCGARPGRAISTSTPPSRSCSTTTACSSTSASGAAVYQIAQTDDSGRSTRCGKTASMKCGY